MVCILNINTGFKQFRNTCIRNAITTPSILCVYICSFGMAQLTCIVNLTAFNSIIQYMNIYNDIIILIYVLFLNLINLLNSVLYHNL